MQVNSNYSMNGVPYETRHKWIIFLHISAEYAVHES